MKNLICQNCENEVDRSSDYCPSCGTLLIENVNCINHKQNEAEGVCLICSEPFCSICGSWNNNKFLCNEHNHYEIYEGMAKIYGDSDYVQCTYIAECLKQEGLHPFIFNRKASPMHLGGSDYSLFRASGDFNGHLINEVKIMLPFTEILNGEDILRNLENE